MAPNDPRIRSAALLSLSLLALHGCTPSSSAEEEDAPAVDSLAPVASSPAPDPMMGGRSLEVVNRSAEAVDEGGAEFVRLSAAPGDGLAWIDGVSFSTGVIELRLRGKNLPGQSFVGVAFNGVDAETYEAVYVRPFNFRAENPVQRGHAVQYIAHPAYTWNRLREERPEVFEAGVEPDLDPDSWVELRVEVDSAQVRAFVGEGTEPELVVERLGQAVGSRVGLWVGNGSAGDFVDVRVTP